jgi:hypothetical protein
MANNFNNAKTHITTALTTVYTTTTGKKSILIGFLVSNTGSTDITIDIAIVNPSTGTYYVGKSLTVFAGTSLEVLQAKIVLVGGDTVQVKASSATADAVISLLEEVN